MSLQQINITFHPVEDRLLMRMTAQTPQGMVEYRVWLTRRFVRLFWQGMDQVLEGELHQNPSVQTQDKEAVKQFQEEAALSRADFSTPYTPEDVVTPMGKDPILASKVQMKATDDGGKMVNIQNELGKGLTLGMTNDMIHSLRKLIADTAQKAQWDLDLSLYSEEEIALAEAPHTVN